MQALVHRHSKLVCDSIEPMQLRVKQVCQAAVVLLRAAHNSRCSIHDQYADDSQVYGSCQSDATSTLSSDITECVDDMYRWMRSNRLQLNGEKTELMWSSSTRRLSQLPSSSIVAVGANVHPVSTVRDLGVYIDSDLGAATHVRKTVSCCFAALRQLRHLRRYVSDDCFRSLVVSLIHSKLDYGNFVLVGLPAYLQRQF